MGGVAASEITGSGPGGKARYFKMGDLQTKNGTFFGDRAV